MMISYKCPHCRRDIKIPQHCIGMTGTCAHCEGRFTVELAEVKEKVVVHKRGEAFSNYLTRWFDTYWVDQSAKGDTPSRKAGKS